MFEDPLGIPDLGAGGNQVPLLPTSQASALLPGLPLSLSLELSSSSSPAPPLGPLYLPSSTLPSLVHALLQDLGLPEVVDSLIHLVQGGTLLL